MPPKICGYSFSSSLSTSSNDNSMPFINHIQLTIVQSSSHLNDLFVDNQQSRAICDANSALNRYICNDLRLFADKLFSEKIRPDRPYLPPCRIDGAINDSQHLFENRLQSSNRLTEKRQSNPQIRYAFYNKGFEMATSTKHRKYSLSHYEVRRKAMPNINEYDAMEYDENDENDDSTDECFDSQKNVQYYSGSSGRDITLLPKLKIRICDEMGARIKHSFDELSFSDDNFNNDDTTIVTPQNTIDTKNSKTKRCEHNTAQSNNDSIVKKSKIPSNESGKNDNDIPICKKCGHRLTIQKQFTNAFV